jgi:hypothetical protein
LGSLVLRVQKEQLDVIKKESEKYEVFGSELPDFSDYLPLKEE